MAKSSKRKTKKPNTSDVNVITITIEQLEELAGRIERKALLDGDYELILQILRSYDYITSMLKEDRVKLKRLKQLLFGAKTESAANVFPEQEDAPNSKGADTPPSDTKTKDSTPKGHGRNGADDYTGAEQVIVEHDKLKAGDSCPKCCEGTLYLIAPKVIVRVSGQPPITATVYRIERVRCKLCGHVFTAPVPEDAQGQKHDESAATMIALLKYGSGMPFNRLRRLEGNLGIPLPASTQWDVVAARVPGLRPIHAALMRAAAGWDLFHNDDTGVKILESMGLKPPPADPEKTSRERKGTFTSIVLARGEGRDAALFFSGRLHAGENLAEVIRHRATDLDSPIQMCDALSRNMSDELGMLIANCLAHARRNFVDVVDNFPEEVKYVIEAFKVIYRVDKEARKRKLSPEKRLKLHRAKSKQTMEKLHRWLNDQFDQRLVEPNSGLGQAIAYMLKHWDKLTLFLRVPKAPLDNNVAERGLKKAIMHRKNSLFYKTAHGASVGDLYMSLIYTCELNRANPFEYLNAAMRHTDDVESNPELWFPWNYRERLAVLSSADSSQPVAIAAG